MKRNTVLLSLTVLSLTSRLAFAAPALPQPGQTLQCNAQEPSTYFNPSHGPFMMTNNGNGTYSVRAISHDYDGLALKPVSSSDQQIIIKQSNFELNDLGHIINTLTLNSDATGTFLREDTGVQASGYEVNLSNCEILYPNLLGIAFQAQESKISRAIFY